MCDRCSSFTRDNSRLGEMVKERMQKGCRCGKQCDRLVEGVCSDCGHYVTHP